VYKVWNEAFGVFEAISVMDVDAIEASGNLNCVGAELAVSQLLSSVARRNICPNFVITRGVFTSAHEPPASLWGYKENAAPRGTIYHGQELQLSLIPPPEQRANYQYIRMELCQHGDMEEFIRNVPDAMLSPNVCRNLLFQMAFSLHVASDRFGLKHYDVKLLNFFLQSALDPSIEVDKHPNVVLRYGVGSHVFRIRMDPNNAHIAKLADYGTSVLRSNADGQPVSLGQFTTLENTPPDYLILGNAAEQGIGHDCFGLGLCMLHLFTGHGPYEEILEKVVCPENLKGKLRKIWKSASHDVIRSVMLYDNEDGQEVEDDTLYNTFYRFLVLFGVPQRRFSSRKHGKVWRAIDTTLLPSKSNCCPDMSAFRRDVERYSLSEGNDERIANARHRLEGMDGAMELLLSLVSFDPKKRATPLDVINSRFMAALIEDESVVDCENDIIKSYTAYQT
jgi:serine/threonine protein kinase